MVDLAALKAGPRHAQLLQKAWGHSARLRVSTAVVVSVRLGIVPVVPVAITTGLQAPRVDTAGLGLLFGDFHESLLDELGEPGHGVGVDRNPRD
jgi:hypothetical protein